MSRQDQRASEGAIAVQSGGDTVINQGVTEDGIRQIIETVAQQQIAFAAVARDIVDARLLKFENQILERFRTDDNARNEAFKDPDFQYLLGRAQHAQARCGDDDVAEALVEMIAQRSRQTERNRLALSLNQAVERAATLTRNEFAELSICYLFRYTVRQGIKSIPEFYKYLNETINLFIDEVSEEDSSYSYLEAQGCATRVMFPVSFRDLLINSYAGFLSKGFAIADVADILDNNEVQNRLIILPCLRNPSLFQANATSKEVFLSKMAEIGLSDDKSQQVWAKNEGALMSEEEIISELKSAVPRIDDMFRVWNKTPLQSLNLTSVGIAIGFSNTVRLSGLEADLAIWIK